MITQSIKSFIFIIFILFSFNLISCETDYPDLIKLVVDNPDFGYVDVNTNPIKIILFKNKSSKSATLVKTELLNGDTSQFTITGGKVEADTQVVGSSQYPITVKFIPKGGAASILLSVEYLDKRGVKRIKGIKLTGFGVEYYALEVDKKTANFKKVKIGGFSDKIIQLKSIGTKELKITSVTSSDALFSVQPNWAGLPVVIQPNETLPFAVRYSPIAEIKSAATVTIVHNATNVATPFVIQLNGEGVNYTAPFIDENFDDEDSAKDWVAAGDWEYGQSDVLYGPATDNSGSGKCFGTKMLDYYSPDQTFTNCTLTSPVFNLKGSVKPMFYYYQWLSVLSNDGGLVQISFDNGVRWFNLDNPNPAYNGFAGGKYVYNGNSDWHLVSIDLTAYKNFEEVMIRFAFCSDASNQTKGWFIDDVILVDADAVPPFKASNPSPVNGDERIPAVGNDIALSWTSGLLTDTFTVYLDMNTNPTMQVSTRQSGTVFTASNLDADETYYWRVDAVNSNGTTKGDVWCFTTADYANIPAILINEVETGNFDYIEIYNASGDVVDISGWELYIYSYCWEIDRSGQVVNANGLNGIYIFPEGTMLDAHEVIIVYEKGLNSRFTTDFNFVLEDTSSAFEIALYCGAKKYNAGCDYVAANLSGVYQQLPPMTNWTGNLVGSGNNRNFYRDKLNDTDDASDWKERLGSDDVGEKNPHQ